MRKCLLCEKSLRGRSDKKFCNDHCRNAFNNQNKIPLDPVVKNINQALSRNRNIIKEMIGENSLRKTARELLILSGFTFRHFTHTYRNKRGEEYFFCYDYGWLSVSNETILLVKEKTQFSNRSL